jgi:3-oxoacyl-[acyl-carrier protein] reductase
MEMLMELKDQVAVVTGSARGIGKEIAVYLARAGAHVVISDVIEEAGLHTVDEIKKMNRDAVWIKADVSKTGDAEHLIEATLDKFGRLDILVNNAGITRDNLLMRMSEDEWNSVIAVNLTGAYNCIRASVKTFLKQKAGRIINIASVVGRIGNAGQANYAASKAGIIGLTKAVAKELAGRNICVNAVAPGFIQTPMTEKLPEKSRELLLQAIPLGKLGQPDDVAKAVLFLSSDSSSYITGQVINVDGGMVMQ